MQFGFEVEAGIDFRIIYIYIIVLVVLSIVCCRFFVEQRFVASFVYFILGTIK